MLLLPEFETHTLPEISIAMPVGVLRLVSRYPVVAGLVAAPAFVNSLTLPMLFAIHTAPFPSIAKATGVLSPPPTSGIGLEPVLVALNSWFAVEFTLQT